MSEWLYGCLWSVVCNDNEFCTRPKKKGKGCSAAAATGVPAAPAAPAAAAASSRIAASPSDNRGEEKRDFANWGLGRDGTRTGLSKKTWTWWKRHPRLIRGTGTRKRAGGQMPGYLGLVSGSCRQACTPYQLGRNGRVGPKYDLAPNHYKYSL